MKMNLNAKKIKQGSISTAIIALVLAGVVGLNLICTSLTDRFSLKLDISAAQKYTISEETKSMLGELKDSVTITVLMDESTFKAHELYGDVSKLLDKYVIAGGDKVKLQYIDPYKNPRIVNKYNEKDNVTSGSVIIERGDKFKVLTINDFYSAQTDQQTGQAYATGLKAEQTLTTAVLTVTNIEVPKAYIVTGHNEQVSTALNTMFKDSGYDVTSLSVMQKDIPEDASLLVISAPQADFGEAELNKIDAFIKKGGSVFYFAGIGTPALPNLDSYIAEWGIKVNNQMVLDAEHSVSHPTEIVPALSDSDVNKSLKSKQDMQIIMPQAKSLDLLFETGTGRMTTPVLETYPSAYTKDMDKLTNNDSFDKAAGDKEGTFTVAALAQYTGGEKTGNLFVCGSVLIMHDELLNAGSLLNKTFLTSVISYATPSVKTISIAAKSLVGEPLAIMGVAVQVVFWGVIVLLPLLIIAAGIIIFIRRRHL